MTHKSTNPSTNAAGEDAQMVGRVAHRAQYAATASGSTSRAGYRCPPSSSMKMRCQRASSSTSTCSAARRSVKRVKERHATVCCVSVCGVDWGRKEDFFFFGKGRKCRGRFDDSMLLDPRFDESVFTVSLHFLPARCHRLHSHREHAPQKGFIQE